MIRFDEDKLAGGGGGDPGNTEVRVAINASILQRMFGTGYYYFDDVPVPYNNILGEERLLLPSQQEALLNKAESQGNLFGHLWIRFSARLAQTQAEFNHDFRLFFCILGLGWLVIALLFVSEMVSGGFGVMACLIRGALLIGLTGIFLVIPAEDLVALTGFVHEDKIQQLVDNMTSLFEKEGYHVDCVHDKRQYCPTLVYVRFKRTNSGTESDVPLAETMLKLQERALEERQDVWIAKQQREFKNSDVCCCGVNIKTIAQYESAIKIVVAIAGFIYAVSCLMQFIPWFISPFGYDGDDGPVNAEWIELNVHRPPSQIITAEE